MKVVGYMRVSSDGQIDGDGFHRQKESIEAFCRTHGLQITYFVREEGVRGTKKIEDRPALTQLMEDHPDVIVIERLDRLARALVVQELTIKEFSDNKIKLYSADHSFEDIADHTADPTRNLLRQLMGSLSEWEKCSFVLKARKSRERIRAEEGKCEGRKKYGESPKRPHEKRICQTVLAVRALGGSYRMIQAAVKANHGVGICLSSITSVLERARKEAP